MSTNQTRKVYPTDLNDNEWNVIAPLMPKVTTTGTGRPGCRGRPRIHCWREVLNAIFYVVKNGCHWRALPHDFPPWQSVYHEVADRLVRIVSDYPDWSWVHDDPALYRCSVLRPPPTVQRLEEIDALPFQWSANAIYQTSTRSRIS